jgi:hypothetical protein
MQTSSHSNSVLAPEAFSAHFDSDIPSKKGEVEFFFASAIDHFFLNTSIPAIATAIITAIAEPTMVVV